MRKVAKTKLYDLRQLHDQITSTHIRKSRSTHLLVEFARFQTFLDNENDLNDASDHTSICQELPCMNRKRRQKVEQVGARAEVDQYGTVLPGAPPKQWPPHLSGLK